MNLLANGLDGFDAATRDIVNPHVTWLAPDSAIVMYTSTGVGGPSRSVLTSTVWTRRDGKWLAAHHQETDLGQ